MKRNSPRRHPVKRAFATAFPLAAVIALGGCSGQPAGPQTPAGPVDLTMAVWSSNEKHLAVFQEIADEYIAAHPDRVSDISFETLSGEYLTSLTTQIAGGAGPDLAWIPESSGKEFVESGVLHELTPALERADGYDLDDIVPAALERWSKDDGVYAYPFSNSPFGVYVNRGLVDGAGREQPADLLAQDEWTWEAAVDIAAASAATGGTGPIIFNSGNVPDQVWDSLTTVWAGFGAQPWSEDGETCELDSPEMIDALDWYNDATYARNGFAKVGESFDFSSGSAAMMIAQLSSSASIDPSIDWDFLPLPSGPEGRVSVVGQAGVGVLSGSEHPEVAADFLAFFTDSENSAKLAQFFPPPRESLLTVETIEAAAPALSAEDVQRTIIDAVPGATIKSASAVYSQISPLIQSGFDALWRADADVAGVTEEICSQVAPLLGG